MIDTDRLYDKLIDKPELQGIPIRFIVVVAVAVMEVLSDDEVMITFAREDIE